MTETEMWSIVILSYGIVAAAAFVVGTTAGQVRAERRPRMTSAPTARKSRWPFRLPRRAS